MSGPETRRCIAEGCGQDTGSESYVCPYHFEIGCQIFLMMCEEKGKIGKVPTRRRKLLKLVGGPHGQK